MKNNVSTLLKTARKDKGLSVKEVSEMLKEHGITAAEKTIYGWESGKRQPDADTFMVLCEIYRIQAFPETATSPDPDGPRDEEESIIMKFVSELTEDQQELLIALLQAMIAQNQRKLSSASGEAGE